MLRRICLSTTTATALILTPTAAASDVQVEQGSKVHFAGSGSCTIGFNDPAQAISYTAGHCGDDGSRATVTVGGVEVSGAFYPSSAFGASTTGNDWGAIRWDDDVQLGPNAVTGDAVADLASLTPGDELCLLSAGVTRCSEFVGRLNNNVYWDEPIGTRGDSGGPVWSPGKGFVAVYSGPSTVFNGAGDTATVNRASKPLNGPGVSEQDELNFISAIKPIGGPVTHEAAAPGEGPSTAEGSSLGTPGVMAVVLVVVAVIAGLAPFAAQYARSVGWI